MSCPNCADVARDLAPYTPSDLPPGVAHSSTDDHSTALEYLQDGGRG